MFGMTFLFLIFLLSSSVFGQFHTTITISGQVLDAENNAPIANANVFLSQTMLGDATDANGDFIITNVPLGTHNLIVSCLGYETQRVQVRLVLANDRAYEFKLQPRVLQAPPVEVTASRFADWKKQLQQFETFFLGTSRNAAKTRILNPEVLSFDANDSNGDFSAVASDLLLIENHALGYRIFYLLESFVLSAWRIRFGGKEEILKFTGNTKFEELTPKNDKQRNEWQKNRRQTYYGSLRHFLATLTAGQINSAGFLVYRMNQLEENLYAAELQQVSLEGLLSPGELSFERNLHFLDVLQVVYTKEMEEREYIYWRLNYDKSALQMTSQKRRESTRPQAQTSWIAMNKSFAIIDTTGYLYDPLAVTVYGYWAWQSVADLLPYEYAP